MGGRASGNAAPSDGVQANAGPGHGLFLFRADPERPRTMATAEFMAANSPDAVARLGELRGRGGVDPIAGTVFPNLSFNFTPRIANLRMWMPRGPQRMEVWTWGIADADVADEVQQQMVSSFQMSFGVSGLVEQDDGDQWQEVTAGGRGYMAGATGPTSAWGWGTSSPTPTCPASWAC